MEKSFLAIISLFCCLLLVKASSDDRDPVSSGDTFEGILTRSDSPKLVSVSPHRQISPLLFALMNKRSPQIVGRAIRIDWKSPFWLHTCDNESRTECGVFMLSPKFYVEDQLYRTKFYPLSSILALDSDKLLEGSLYEIGIWGLIKEIMDTISSHEPPLYYEIQEHSVLSTYVPEPIKVIIGFALHDQYKDYVRKSRVVDKDLPRSSSPLSSFSSLPTLL